MLAFNTKVYALAVPLLFGAAVPFSVLAGSQSDRAASGDALTPIDASGELSEAALRERVQFILGGDARAPARGLGEGAGTVLGGLVFKAVSGGSGAGQDLAKPAQE